MGTRYKYGFYRTRPASVSTRYKVTRITHTWDIENNSDISAHGTCRQKDIDAKSKMIQFTISPKPSIAFVVLV